MPAAINAIGAVTAHGVGCAPLLNAVLEGKTGIRALTRFSAEGLCSQLAAEAPGDAQLVAASARFDLPPPGDRASRLLLAAAAEAMVGRDVRPNPRRAVVVGTTKGALELALSRWELSEESAEDTLSRPARALASAVGAEGPVLTLSAACASSAFALGEALSLVEDGVCDEVVVGGTEALHPFIYRGFHALKALSAAPAAPFDLHRSGLSLGEGAAVLVLESEGRAPFIRLEGFGAATDGFDQTAPDPSGRGLANACRKALQRAGIGPEAIDRYHAHGTATLHNDRMEAAVHAALFRDRPVPVSAVKGVFGHTLGAAGALDAAVCALTLARGVVPPVTHLKQLDPEARVPAVIGGAREHPGAWALVANAGFGGINSALVLRRVERAP